MYGLKEVSGRYIAADVIHDDVSFPFLRCLHVSGGSAIQCLGMPCSYLGLYKIPNSRSGNYSHDIGGQYFICYWEISSIDSPGFIHTQSYLNYLCLFYLDK